MLSYQEVHVFKWFFSVEPIEYPPRTPTPCVIEGLEERQLLSASTHVHHHVAHAAKPHAHHAHHASKTATASTTTSTTTSGSESEIETGDRRFLNTILFSQAPTAVQNGLDALAITDSLSAPTSTQKVYLGNSNGVETYTIEMTSAGTVSRLTVDPNGNPVTQPTQTTTTWGVLSGTGAGSNASAAAEITAIATALSLTAPTSTTVVDVRTTSAGAVTYSVRLSSSSSSTTDNGWYDRGTEISVDSNGNPVGDEEIPFSTLPTPIQNGINAHVPAGATALPTTSTQTVDVRTLNGITFYSTTFTSSGTSTTVTVNAAGAPVSLPATSTDTFLNIPLAAQNELQTLASAEGFTGTISTTQSVTIYDEGNGTKIYSITLPVTDSTTSQTYDITISVDQLGNPTVPPRDHGGEGCGGGFDGENSSGAGFTGYDGSRDGDFGFDFHHH